MEYTCKIFERVYDVRRAMPDGRYEDAALGPLLSDICCQLGSVLSEQGFNDEAEVEFRVALMIDPHGAGGEMALEHMSA